MEKFLNEARKLAYTEIKKTGMPIKLHADLATEVGKKIAKELGANADIIEAGTLLMDCMLGQAKKDNRQNEHISISLDKANELLKDSVLSESEKENIRHCIIEHHGAEKFYSLESEICCNADCYRFVSIKGFSYALKYLSSPSFEELTTLLKNKVNEKWNALSLEICKKELAGQHDLIIEFLKNLK